MSQSEARRGSASLKDALFLLVFAFLLFGTLDGFTYIGQHLARGQINSLVLGLLLVLALLYVPPVRGKRVPMVWHAITGILVVGVIGATAYYVLNFWNFVARLGTARDPIEFVLGPILLVAVLETVRRAYGLSLLILGTLFLLYPLVADQMPSIFFTRAAAPSQLVGYLWLSEAGLVGSLTSILLEFIFPFLVFAVVLNTSGAGTFFVDLSLSLVAKAKGGTAKGAALSNYFLGMFTGSSVADIATLGPLFLPMMRRTGYSGEYAGGVLAAASTAAQISPPVMGAVAFIMAQILGIPYTQIVLIALVPSFLFYLCLLMLIHLDAAKMNVGNLSEHVSPRIETTVRNGWYYFLPVFVLIAMLAIHVQPRYAALASAGAMLIVGLFLRAEQRTSLSKLRTVTRETVESMIPMGPIIGVAAILVGVLAVTALTFRLSTQLVDLSGGNLYFLLISVAIASLVLGMGLPTIPAYIVVSVIFAPVLLEVGLPQVVSHMFVFYFGLAAMLTPPIAVSVFVVISMTGGSLWRTGYHATRLGAATFLVPFIFAIHPALLFPQNDPLAFVVAFILATGSSLSLAVGLAGFLRRPVPVAWRVLLFAGALTPLAPVETVFHFAGLMPLMGLMLYQIFVGPSSSAARSTISAGT